jgi:hypothetical protein
LTKRDQDCRSQCGTYRCPYGPELEPSKRHPNLELVEASVKASNKIRSRTPADFVESPLQPAFFNFRFWDVNLGLFAIDLLGLPGELLQILGSTARSGTGTIMSYQINFYIA